MVFLFLLYQSYKGRPGHSVNEIQNVISIMDELTGHREKKVVNQAEYILNESLKASLAK